ncbi:hypothetical protein E8E13_000636 [Curvularia kusanoi]|uniref:peptidylprolyl isomerase n=1 Tax=Curvularia kusanoi TaxID=90978 RepID=A0A9P4T7E3_CURKU|nr:hypothetical protein E8E13_000636 [Curvularia kusanoi]
MPRYRVRVVLGGQTASLLVVLSEDQLCSALRDTVRRRLPTIASKLGLTADNEVDVQITLHLDTVDGPVVDTEDLLSDALPDYKETVFAVIEQSRMQSATTNTEPPVQPSKALNLRVVTPELAHEHADVNSIPTTAHPLPLSSTLSELRAAVCQHLAVPIGDDVLAELDCNCSAARQIDTNASLSERGVSDSDALHTLLVVYEDNKVAVLRIGEPTETSIKCAAHEQLQEQTEGKLLREIGGVKHRNDELNPRYLKLPVLAVCSYQSHRTKADSKENDRRLTLDLHTLECPIDITAHNESVTLVAAGLDDCAVNGILTVFAVQRVCSTLNGYGAAANVGKAAIFQKQRAWEQPLGQSERGLANLLSTLRKFTDITSGSQMEEDRQDAVLRILHLMTRFPPAVRTAYVLMRGETPLPSECAALSQYLYEILKDMIPEATIRNDPQRFLEGSRLLFGLILSKAKTLRVSISSKNSELPYTSMRVYDLRNAVTMLPVRGVPVQAKIGLLDAGFYDAFAEDGVLDWNNSTDTAKASTLDRTLSRVATLAGGKRTKLVVFSPDAIAFTRRYPDKDIAAVVSQAEATNLQYLATMCSNNGLGVITPSDLPSASAPVLTLDRDGFLAVYVGREGCGGVAGRDILMFRPLSGEEAVDVSIITQLSVPILARRNADGTAIFEAYGAHHRQVKEPDEAVVVCVDLSRSMDERCGFMDIQENEDAAASINPRHHQVAQDAMIPAVEHPGGERLALEELQEYLLNHDSFEDILAMVLVDIGDDDRLTNARKVLDLINQLDQQHLNVKSERLADTRERATSSYYRLQVTALERDLIPLSNRIARMKHFADSLCAFLVYRAEIAGSLPEPQPWRPGAAPPTASEQRPSAPPESAGYTIPNELLCPISSDLMDDPVMTVDNHTYERKNIERWFFSRQTSPLTNLPLVSLDPRADAQTKQKIDAFIKGADLYTAQNFKEMQVVTMKYPLGSCTLRLPFTLTLARLHKLAFRLTKGRYTNFELRHKNAVTFSITPLDSISPSDAKPGEMCLIKVYAAWDDNSPICSYWEPRSVTKTLDSVIFRFNRQRFSAWSARDVIVPPVIWHNLYFTGDGHSRGTTTMHWNPLNTLLSAQFATGSVNEERMIDDRSPAQSHRHSTSGPLVLKLRLGPKPSQSLKSHKTLSRLDVLKQMFDAFINRLLAYNFQTHVGLVTFSTTASVSQNITHAVENFRHQLNNTEAEGDTAIWDSVALAMDQLLQYAFKYPSTKMRIICISDGEDNKSNRLVHDLVPQLNASRIVVDSFCLGKANNKALQALSHMTGGYKLRPNSLDEAMAICEMEPVLSLLERPAVVLPHFASRHANSALWRFEQAKKSTTVDRATQDGFPPRKAHPQLASSFVELINFARNVSQTRSDSNLRLSRIHTEIRTCGALVHPHYDVYICEENFGFWKIVMQGPPESTYAGGTFLFYLEMTEDYPMSPPKARFETSTVDTTTKDVVDTIYSLLLVPEFSDPINTVVTLNYHWDEVQFKEEAQAHIRKYATKSRAEWRAEITS